MRDRSTRPAAGRVAGARRGPAGGGSSLIRDAEIEQTLERIAGPLFRAAGMNPATVRHLHRRGPRAERLRRRRPEHLRPHRPPDRARDHRPGPRRHRPRARPHHRRPPDPPRPGAAGRPRHRRDRHARRRRRRASAARPRPASPSPPAPARRRTAARSPTAAPRRRAPTRPACATSPPPAADPAAMLDVLDHFRGQDALTRPLRRPLRPEPPDVVRAHRADRGPGRQDARAAQPPSPRTPTGTPAWWRSSTPSSTAPPRPSAATPRATPPSPRALARAVAWHRRPDPARARRRRRRADRRAPRRPLLPRARGPVPARVRPRRPRPPPPTARRSPSRRRSR